MFTGLIHHRGSILNLIDEAGIRKLEIHAPQLSSEAEIGDSISVNGICLTVTELTPKSFWVDIIPETLAVTTAGSWEVGKSLHLEGAARFGDKIDGHFIGGHIDETGKVIKITKASGQLVLRISVSEKNAPILSYKGSIAVDGVSLTISEVSAPKAGAGWFEISLIPQTLEYTNLGELALGDSVNIESDMLARQVARILGFTKIGNS